MRSPSNRTVLARLWRGRRLCGGILLMCVVASVAVAGEAWPRQQLAEFLGTDPRALRLLDEDQHAFLFIDRSIRTFSLRNESDGSTVTLHVDSQTGEPVEVEELATLNRQAAEQMASRMDASLRDVLLHHPELKGLQIAVTQSGQAPKPVTLDADQVLAYLRQAPADTRFRLTEEPVVLD